MEIVKQILKLVVAGSVAYSVIYGVKEGAVALTHVSRAHGVRQDIEAGQYEKAQLFLESAAKYGKLDREDIDNLRKSLHDSQKDKKMGTITKLLRGNKFVEAQNLVLQAQEEGILETNTLHDTVRARSLDYINRLVSEDHVDQARTIYVSLDGVFDTNDSAIVEGTLQRNSLEGKLAAADAFSGKEKIDYLATLAKKYGGRSDLDMKNLQNQQTQEYLSILTEALSTTNTPSGKLSTALDLFYQHITNSIPQTITPEIKTFLTAGTNYFSQTRSTDTDPRILIGDRVETVRMLGPLKKRPSLKYIATDAPIPLHSIGIVTGHPFKDDLGATIRVRFEDGREEPFVERELEKFSGSKAEQKFNQIKGLLEGQKPLEIEMYEEDLL